MPKPCICGYANLKNMSRHKMACPELNTKDAQIQKLTEKLNYYESGHDRKELLDKIQSLESGQEYTRLKYDYEKLKNEMLEGQKQLLECQNQVVELQKKVLEKPTNVKNVNVMNQQNNIVLNIVAFGNEPQLDEENVRQMIRESMSQCDEIVPKFLKRKHFSQDNTRNIRFNTTADKIETVQRDAKGKLRWKKERKPPQKFCKDLALQAVTELNEVYGAERNPRWKTFNRLRYGENVHEDLKKSHPHPEVKLAIDVQRMIVSESSYANDDDDEEE